MAGWPARGSVLMAASVADFRDCSRGEVRHGVRRAAPPTRRGPRAAAEPPRPGDGRGRRRVVRLGRPRRLPRLRRPDVRAVRDRPRDLRPPGRLVLGHAAPGRLTRRRGGGGRGAGHLRRVPGRVPGPAAGRPGPLGGGPGPGPAGRGRAGRADARGRPRLQRPAAGQGHGGPRPRAHGRRLPLGRLRLAGHLRQPERRGLRRADGRGVRPDPVGGVAAPGHARLRAAGARGRAHRDPGRVHEVRRGGRPVVPGPGGAAPGRLVLLRHRRHRDQSG